MHFPFPIPHLSHSALGQSFATGFGQAAHELNAPVGKVQILCRNLYRFDRVGGAQPANEEEARKLGQLAEATMKPEVGRMLDRWNQEHLPAVQAHLARLRAMDIENESGMVLAGYVQEIETILTEFWTIHFRIVLPLFLGLQLFDEFYLDLFGGELGDGHVLLNGVESQSIRAGMGLFELAKTARKFGLADTIRDADPSRLPTILKESDSGRSLMAEVRAYLDDFGYRQDLFDLSTITWFEDPSIALANVRNYLISDRDPYQEYAANRAKAESALADADAALAMYPEAVRGQFEALVAIARAASFLQEEHNFYIDQAGLSTVRLTFLRIADRLTTAGVLEQPDDIFYLELPQIRSLLEDLESMTDRKAVHDLVQTRRRHLIQARSMTPPPFLGSPPGAPGDNPMERATGRFFGGPPKQSDRDDQIKGNAGSRGLVTGTAFVARTLDEATGVRAGQILVAITTMPAWTPLFGVASAVVTETGGPLSHCAIVAREYGIPAVVGAYGATERIRTGQTITVDGTTGIVTIEDE
jgi:pyruvate,water dikinase